MITSGHYVQKWKGENKCISSEKIILHYLPGDSALVHGFHGNVTGRCFMQEEVTQKTIALVIKTAKLDASVLRSCNEDVSEPP